MAGMRACKQRRRAIGRSESAESRRGGLEGIGISNLNFSRNFDHRLEGGSTGSHDDAVPIMIP